MFGWRRVEWGVSQLQLLIRGKFVAISCLKLPAYLEGAIWMRNLFLYFQAGICFIRGDIKVQ